MKQISWIENLVHILAKLKKNNDKVQFLMSHAMARISFRGKLVQIMADLQTQLTGLRSQLQEKKGESEEK